MISISTIIKTRPLFQKSMFSSQFRFLQKDNKGNRLLDRQEKKKESKGKITVPLY